LIFTATLLAFLLPQDNKTISLWVFDEQKSLYPSQVLENSSENDIPMVLGLGGAIVEGKFGNALEPKMHPKVQLPKGSIRFGLVKLEKKEGEKVAPLTWHNAEFAALMTSGENQLRKEVGFAQPTATKLNIGDFDWTVEFWFYPNNKDDEDGTVFEIGTSPRGENDKVTRLSLDAAMDNFMLFNNGSGNTVKIPTDINMNEWQHIAFVYSSSDNRIKHYVNGKMQKMPDAVELKQIEVGEADYMTLLRNGLWKNPLQGKIDELRFSEGMIYTGDFIPPVSFAESYPQEELVKGPPLLFGEDSKDNSPIPLGNRKHVFIDDAFLAEVGDVEFNVNPPEKKEMVIGNIKGPFRKHLTVVEDEEGLIRIYNSAEDDYLQVHTSEDGVNFKKPNTGIEHKGKNNIVIPMHNGGKGNPFIDPNGKGDDKWKYVSGYHNRGLYLYTSPDGYNWTRKKTAILPFQIGTQSATFYDDQRQLYVSYHRSGVFHTPGGATQRSSVLAETKSLYNTIPFNALTQKEYWELDKKYRIRSPLPWWLDNGPLSPGDFGMELPHAFDPTEADPVGSDIYITKAQKYEYAPDTYLAFPVVYFHYEADGPLTRQILIDSTRLRGAGPLESQIAVSRDGINWQRRYQPAYVEPGMHGGIDIKTAYIAAGMVKRGDEIWQYYFGEPHYHSAWIDYPLKRSVFRLVQRLDGFISIDSPYEKEAYVKTKPFIFEGNRLELNINTGAVGYTQVGFLDKNGDPIDGYSMDECVYINGDFIDTEVEWLQNAEDFEDVHIDEGESTEILQKAKVTKDVSPLEGKVVQLVFRMRGSKLYSMKFSNK
jgi:hypothetical protein